eukprot:m.164942 g.164942  ORF g.164942 m.164942 type:complete len:1106 (-) comp15250_c0_seq1:2259-5576(-)
MPLPFQRWARQQPVSSDETGMNASSSTKGKPEVIVISSDESSEDITFLDCPPEGNQATPRTTRRSTKANDDTVSLTGQREKETKETQNSTEEKVSVKQESHGVRKRKRRTSWTTSKKKGKQTAKRLTSFRSSDEGDLDDNDVEVVNGAKIADEGCARARGLLFPSKQAAERDTQNGTRLGRRTRRGPKELTRQGGEKNGRKAKDFPENRVVYCFKQAASSRNGENFAFKTAKPANRTASPTTQPRVSKRLRSRPRRESLDSKNHGSKGSKRKVDLEESENESVGRRVSRSSSKENNQTDIAKNTKPDANDNFKPSNSKNGNETNTSTPGNLDVETTYMVDDRHVDNTNDTCQDMDGNDEKHEPVATEVREVIEKDNKAKVDTTANNKGDGPVETKLSKSPSSFTKVKAHDESSTDAGTQPDKLLPGKTGQSDDEQKEQPDHPNLDTPQSPKAKAAKHCKSPEGVDASPSVDSKDQGGDSPGNQDPPQRIYTVKEPGHWRVQSNSLMKLWTIGLTHNCQIFTTGDRFVSCDANVLFACSSKLLQLAKTTKQKLDDPKTPTRRAKRKLTQSPKKNATTKTKGISLEITENKEYKITAEKTTLGAVRAYIMFCYTGQLALDLELGLSLLNLAQSFGNKIVEKHCEQALTDILDVKNCLNYIQRLDKKASPTLLERAIDLAEKEFRKLDEKQLLSMKLDDLLLLLESDDLRIDSELTLLRFVEAWAKQERESNEIKTTLDTAIYELTRNIRLLEIDLTKLKSVEVEFPNICTSMPAKQLLIEVSKCKDMQEAMKLNPQIKVEPRSCNSGLRSVILYGRAAVNKMKVMELHFNAARNTWFEEPCSVKDDKYEYTFVGEGRCFAIDCMNRLIFRQDPKTNLWMSFSEQDQPMRKNNMKRLGVTLVATTERVYAIGGTKEPADKPIGVTTVEQYDIRGNEWYHIQSLGKPRYRAAGAFCGGKIYACGGRNGWITLKCVEQYDPVTKIWATIAPLQTGRSHAVAVAVAKPKDHTSNDDKQVEELYVLGGYNGQGERLDSVEKLDAKSKKWISITPMIHARADFCVAEIQGRIYVFGGTDDNRIACECFDPNTNMWTPIASLEKTLHPLGVIKV